MANGELSQVMPEKMYFKNHPITISKLQRKIRLWYSKFSCLYGIEIFEDVYER